MPAATVKIPWSSPLNITTNLGEKYGTSLKCINHFAKTLRIPACSCPQSEQTIALTSKVRDVFLPMWCFENRLGQVADADEGLEKKGGVKAQPPPNTPSNMISSKTSNSKLTAEPALKLSFVVCSSRFNLKYSSKARANYINTSTLSRHSSLSNTIP